ncbi:hypothetical protein DRQ25_10970 [Candidatus Fermentibacteria bacterium]|nr:MAG: hypothetical protein DRQ25_10970 [Candidatus Fermentibacteria bacterium]
MICSFRLSVSGFLALFISLFFILPVCSDDYTTYIDDWEIKRTGLEVISIQVFPSELLPDGIDHLDFMILDDPLDGTELAVIGHGQYTLCFGTVPFDMTLNPAKTFAYFSVEDSLIILSSEYPSRTTTCNMSYTWEKDEQILIPVESWISDWSADLLASADSLLEIGEIRQAADSISMMFYGWAYYDASELSCRFLRAAHAASKDAPREEALDYYDAAVYAFDVIQYDDLWFLSFSSLEEFLNSDYAEYIEAEELAGILRDYAGMFRDNGFAVETVLDNIADILEGKE